MAYKFPIAKSTYTYGVANVRISDDKKRVQVIFRNENEDGEPNKPLILQRADCPDYVKKGTYHVTLSGDKRKMFSMTPVQGVFESDGAHVTLVHEKDQKPTPKPDNFDNICFQVEIEITKGDCAGMKARYPYLGLHYAFLPVEDENGKQIVGFPSKRGIHVVRLMNFIETLGVADKGPIAWSDNILPVIQKRILAANKPFQMVIKSETKENKQGENVTRVFIDSLMAIESESDDDNELDEVEDKAEEKTTSKKPAKSAPAKSSKKAVEEDDEELPWEDGDLPDDEEDEESDKDSDEADFS